MDYHDNLYLQFYEKGRAEERASLSSKVEEMKWTEDEIGGHDGLVRYNQGLDRVLTYLREPDASQGCCGSCCCGECVETGVIDLSVRHCIRPDCPCHTSQGDKRTGV